MSDGPSGSSPVDESAESTSRQSRSRTAWVFAPSPLLTVTVEQGTSDVLEVHLHAGGQGFWFARMLVVLGLDACLRAPLGGEAGPVLRALIEAEGITVNHASTTRANGAYVHDRRGGERVVVADMPPAALSRHEVDALFSATLAAGMATDDAFLGGTSNTRRGLATGQRQVIEQLAQRIDVLPLAR